MIFRTDMLPWILGILLGSMGMPSAHLYLGFTVFADFFFLVDMVNALFIMEAVSPGNLPPVNVRMGMGRMAFAAHSLVINVAAWSMQLNKVF